MSLEYHLVNRSDSKTDTYYESLLHRSTLAISKPPLPRRLIRQKNPTRIYWELIIVFLALYNGIIDPYIMAFSQNLSYGIIYDIIDTIIDLIFAIDIYVILHTSYTDRYTGEEVTNLKRIRANYCSSGRLFIDVVSCFPLVLLRLLIHFDSQLFYIKLLKLIRILRLTKIAIMLKVRIEVKIRLRLIVLVLSILIYMHILACAWMILISVDQVWVPIPYTISRNPLIFYELDSYEQYLLCLYTAMYTLVGMEILPYDLASLILSSLFIILGTLLFTYILGEIAAQEYMLKMPDRALSTRMDLITTTMYRLKLSTDLQIRIINYFEKNYHHQLRREDCELLQSYIPQSIMGEMVYQLAMSQRLQFPVFNPFPEVIEFVTRNVKPLFFVPQETLISKDQEESDFFMIIHGCCSVMVEGLDKLNYYVRVLREKEYFGEIGAIYDINTTATVQTLGFGFATVLPRKKLKYVLKMYPDIQRQLKVSISSYSDPYRDYFINMLRKISYLRDQSKLVIDALLYKMKMVNFQKNSLLVEEADIADRIFFIVKGEVSVYARIQDSQLLEMTRKKSKNALMKYVNIKRLHADNMYLDDSRTSHLQLCSLGKGSILCPKQVLMDEKVHTYVIADRLTQTFVLERSAIEEVCSEFQELKDAVQKVKNRYTHLAIEDSVIIMPQLDVIKRFTIQTNEFNQGERLTLKFKNAVLMIIMRNRPKINLGFHNISTFIHHLTAIQHSSKNNLLYIAEMIEKKKIKHLITNLIKISPDPNLSKPISIQFARTAYKSNEHFVELNKNYMKVADKTMNMNDLTDSVLRKINLVNRLIDIAYSYLF